VKNVLSRSFDTGFRIDENFGRDIGERVDAPYGSYVAEPLYIDGEPVLFPYDLEVEHFRRYEELFHGFIPAPIPEYSSVEAFVADERPAGDGPGTLNFLGYFQNPESVIGLAHQSRQVFARLAFLDPVLVEELQTKVGGENVTSLTELSPQTQVRVFNTYNFMTHLVDVNDDARAWIPAVGAEGEYGYVFDPDYLKH